MSYGERIMDAMLGGSPIEGVLANALHGSAVLKNASEIDKAYETRIDDLEDARSAAQLQLIEEQRKQSPSSQVIGILQDRVNRYDKRIKRAEESRQHNRDRFDELKAPRTPMAAL